MKKKFNWDRDNANCKSKCSLGSCHHLDNPGYICGFIECPKELRQPKQEEQG